MDVVRVAADIQTECNQSECNPPMIPPFHPTPTMIVSVNQYIRTPISGLGFIPFPKGDITCGEEFYTEINSGGVLVEKGESIEGAVRIDRSAIKSFDTVGQVGNADGTRVFELLDGRKFRLIDRFNEKDYVVGYIVQKCPKPCTACPDNCRRAPITTTYYARKNKISANDIPVAMNRRTVICSPSNAVRPTCSDQVAAIKKQYGLQ